MKQKKRLRILILLVLACLVLLATGTYAAYTNTAFVKRVVTTGIDTSAVPFSSNYLYEFNGGSYISHVITASADSTSIDLTLFNSPKNDSTQFSSTDIVYTISITVLDKDGNQVQSPPLPAISPEEYQNGTLTGGQFSFDSYTLTFTKETIAALADCTLRITATSISGLTPPITLAADFQVVSTSGESTAWHGQFTDSGSAKDLDAFNYEISGTAKGKVTIDWSQSANYVTLSRWFWLDLDQTPNPTAKNITFSVGGEDQPTSYLLQFYRLKGSAEGDEYPNISIVFQPDDPSASTTP